MLDISWQFNFHRYFSVATKTKKVIPELFFYKVRSCDLNWVTFEFNFSAKGTTLFFKASPRYVNASSAPAPS